MFYVYILKLKNSEYYTGFTKDLKVQVERHSQNSTLTTTRIKPQELVFYASFKDKSKALDFEKYLKSSSGLLLETKD